MNFKLHMLSLFATLAFPLVASAQEEGKDRPGRRPNMQRPGTGPNAGGGPIGPMATIPIMKVLDTDNDGTLSPSEIANASKTLMQLDKNGDGVITADEMRPDFVAGGIAKAGPGTNGPMMGKLFESRDKDGDGKLAGDEIPERMQDKVKMIDKDGDGAISKAEFASVAARFEEGAAGKKPGKEGNSSGGVKPKRPIE